MNEKIATLQKKAEALGSSTKVQIEGNSSDGFNVYVGGGVQSYGKTLDEAVKAAEDLLDEEARSRIVRLKANIDAIKAVWTA